MKARKTTLTTVLMIALGLLAWYLNQRSGKPAPDSKGTSTRTEPTGASGGEKAVLDAFRARRSDVVVEVEATVTRILEDDRDGSRHQKFLVKLSGGHSLLIAHNIDLAPRAPLKRGDTVSLRGEYEYNDRGGVLHWTHHDPKGRRPGGWIRHRGKTYK